MACGEFHCDKVIFRQDLYGVERGEGLGERTVMTHQKLALQAAMSALLAFRYLPRAFFLCFQHRV